MARFTIPADRFPLHFVPVHTSAGMVEFIDHVAEVDDEDLAAALREVPAVFGITEDGGPEPDDDPDDPDGENDGDESGDDADADDGEVERPSVRAPKAAWVAYAEEAHDIPAAEAEAMTKAELIETFGG